MIDFVETGSENGVGYAPQAQGSGGCPASARCSPTSRSQAIIEYVRGL